VFTAFWSMGIFAAYSLVPYKTPWLQLSIVLPLILMAGYALGQMYEHWKTAGAIPVLLTVVAVGASAYQAIQISFLRYDDESMAYSYAHSRRDLLNLVNEIDRIAAGSAAGKNIGIVVMSPEHWPLPWYLRDYPNVGYWGKVVTTSEPIIIAHENQRLEVERLLGNKYRLYSVHDLRPGNRLFLYLRRDIQPRKEAMSS
jgi:predicted membrane-bound mannosyltransferase